MAPDCRRHPAQPGMGAAALCDHSLMLITSPCVVSLTWTLADAQGATLDELTDPVEFFYGGDDLLAKVEEALAGYEPGAELSLHLEPVQLGPLLRGVRLPRMHLSGENGPVAGALSDELRRRVEASFAMVIVVHDNYAHSSWCLKELEYFRALWGDAGLHERLYILALSEREVPGAKLKLPAKKTV